jgi:hypothetical protein
MRLISAHSDFIGGQYRTCGAERADGGAEAGTVYFTANSRLGLPYNVPR